MQNNYHNMPETQVKKIMRNRDHRIMFYTACSLHRVGTLSAELWSRGCRTPVTEKATNHQNINEGYRHHYKQLEPRPEVNAFKVVLLNAAVTKLNLWKCSLQFKRSPQIVTYLICWCLQRTANTLLDVPVLMQVWCLRGHFSITWLTIILI